MSELRINLQDDRFKATFCGATDGLIDEAFYFVLKGLIYWVQSGLMTFWI